MNIIHHVISITPIATKCNLFYRIYTFTHDLFMVVGKTRNSAEFGGAWNQIDDTVCAAIFSRHRPENHSKVFTGQFTGHDSLIRTW